MERDGPEVTVTDPRRPADRAPRPPDERDAPSAQRPHRRRVLAAVLAVLLTAAGARAALATVEERRLDREVALSRAPSPQRGASFSYDPERRTGTYETVLRLRNRGPRAVRVVDARAGALRFAGDLRLAADGGTGDVVLSRTVPCPGDGSRPDPDPGADAVVLRVVTRGGQREVSVGGDDGLDASARFGGQRACGYPGLEDAVFVAAQAGGTAGRTLTARVHVAHGSLRPVQLLSVAFARGLDVVGVRRVDTGRPLALPVRLPVPPLGAAGNLSFDVNLSVNCGAVAASGGILFGDVDLLVEDLDDGDLSQITGRLEGARTLRRSVAEVCS